MTDTETPTPAKGYSATALGMAGGCGYFLGVAIGAWVATKNSPCAQHGDDDQTITRVSRASAAVTRLRDKVASVTDPETSSGGGSGPTSPPPSASTAPPVDVPKPDMPAPAPPMTLPPRTLPSPRVPMPMEPVRAPVVTDEPATAGNGSGPKPRVRRKGSAA
jgi:hypothetical protein